MLSSFEEIKEAYSGEPAIALDLETTGLSPWKDRIAVIGLYGPVCRQPALLHYPRGEEVPWEVLEWLAGFEEIITHNGTQFDILFLANAGMDWARPRWYDTLIGEQVVTDTSRHDVRVNLKDTVKRHLGKTLNKSIDHGSWANDELTQEQIDYVAGDIVYLVELRNAQVRKAKADESGDKLRALKFEMSLLPAVVQMELNGLPVDVLNLSKYVDQSIDHKQLMADEIASRIGNDVLLTSPVQVKRRLNEKYPGMFPDTRMERFMDYRNLHGDIAELSDFFIQFRQAEQRRKMFQPAWLDKHIVYHNDGVPRIHGRFWQVGTNTGRFSASDPNLQQLPRDARQFFADPSGRFLMGKSDYAAIEVRVAAAIANDRTMIDAFNSGEDIHTTVAAASFGVPPEAVTKEQRKVAKAISFTFLFGGGLETFIAYAASNGSTIDRDDAQDAMDRFFERFSAIKSLREKAEFRCATRRAVPITYPTGLKRVLIGESLKPTVLLNNLVQGTAAAGLKMALVRMKDSGVIDHVVAVVHDEVVFSAKPDEIEDVRTLVDDCMLEGMLDALAEMPAITIAVESRYGKTWKGDDATERITSKVRGSLEGADGVAGSAAATA